jgi:DNA-binding NtrC family response regulator
MDINTILVVDDEESYRNMLSEMLKDRAGRIITAKNGKEALDALTKEGGTDIAITDIKMPGMDGFQLLQNMKALDPNLSVIVMTGYSELYNTDEAMQKGADGYISKPFKKDEIIALITRALRLSVSSNRDRLIEEKKQLLEYATFANRVIAASDYPSPHKDILLAMGERIKRSAVSFLRQLDD